MIYLLVFVIASFMLYLSTLKKYSKYKIYIEILTIVFISIFVGCRSLSVGTDVSVYLKNMFDLARNSNSIFDFYQMSWQKLWYVRYIKNIEPAFNLLVFLVTKIFNNIHVLMFVIELLIIFPIYYGLKKIKYFHNYEWLGLFIYNILFFNFGLNAMRQSIAVSIIFYAFCYLYSDSKHKYLVNLCLIIIAFLFHVSAIFYIVPLFFYCFMEKNEKKYILIKTKKVSYNHLIMISFLICMILFSFISTYLKPLFELLGLGSYYYYFSAHFSLSLKTFIKKIPLVIIVLFSYKKIYKEYHNMLFFIFMILCDFVMVCFFRANVYIERVSIYYYIFCVIFIPLIMLSKKDTSIKIKYILKNEININSKLYKTFVIVYFIALWFYDIVIVNKNETLPFILFDYFIK